MKFKGNLLILTVILIGILILIAGCTTPIIEEEEGDVPSGGTISIVGTAVTTNDTTPPLTISATGATYMAFSGNGTTWSAWVAYATTYSLFNITTGAGCTSGDGTKIVYVKFKNDVGESTKVYDSIILDTVAPKLSTAAYTDVNSSGTVNSGDKITFTFNDEMDTTTVTSSNVATNLLLSDSKSYGTSPAVSWDSGLKICYVTLGASPTLVVGTTTVNPSASVKDTAGNADNSTAITISGLLNVLASVSISPVGTSTTAGGAVVTLTATALNTVGTTMTASCTFAWTISGTAGGTISPATGTSTVYTPPASGTGIDTITVIAVYAGVSKTATSAITVSAGVAVVDSAKLFVSAQNQNAKYTSLPTGATVKVYSNAANDAAAAQTAGVKVAISSSNSWTNASIAIVAADYIFFTVTDSGGWTSPITADGQIPTKPDVTALGSIQATSKNTVTSSVAGNVTGNDKITLYVGGLPYSAATSVGSTMTVTTDLVTGNAPTYTRTNPDGHESVASAADGKILILHTATDNDVAGATGVIEPTDTLTLTFWDGGGNLNVDVNVPITISNISWVASATTAALDNGTGTLAGTSTNVATVILIATANCTDFAALETVDFNVLTNTPIVDNAGGNQVLPAATATTFTDGTDF